MEIKENKHLQKYYNEILEILDVGLKKPEKLVKEE